MNNLFLTLLLILVFIKSNSQVSQQYRAEQMLILTEYVRGATGNIITYSNEGSTVVVTIPTVKIASMVNSTYKEIEEAIKDPKYREKFTKALINELSEMYIDIFETCEFDSLKVRFHKLNKITLDGKSFPLDRTLSKNRVKLERQ